MTSGERPCPGFHPGTFTLDRSAVVRDTPTTCTVCGYGCRNWVRVQGLLPTDDFSSVPDVKTHIVCLECSRLLNIQNSRGEFERFYFDGPITITIGRTNNGTAEPCRQIGSFKCPHVTQAISAPFKHYVTSTLSKTH